MLCEDGLRCLYKERFNVSQEVEVEFVGTLTTGLRGPKRHFSTQFLQQMPTNLHLVEESSGVLFFTCNRELAGKPLLTSWESDCPQCTARRPSVSMLA